MKDVVYSINGPVVTVRNSKTFSMQEMVYVGNKRLMGEVISVNKDKTTIQVYESTTGLMPGEPVYSTGQPISVTLGPGILKNIFDGVERPLEEIAKEADAFIPTGAHVDPLPTDKLWDVTMKVKVGDRVQGGDIYATIPETDLIEHRLMVPPYVKGTIKDVKADGQYKLEDTIVTLTQDNGVDLELKLYQ